jgi:hypothetical protein
VFPLVGDYAIHAFAETDAVTEADVLALWAREGAVPEDEARRRVSEVEMVATYEGELVGIMSAYLARNEQLRIDAWHGRVFVADAHRKSHVAAHMTVPGRERVMARVARGEAPGVAWIVEVENPGPEDGVPAGVLGARARHVRRREPDRGPRLRPLLPRSHADRLMQLHQSMVRVHDRRHGMGLRDRS